MLKLICQNCGQVWYSAYAGGNCDTCGGKLVPAETEQKADSNAESNLVYLSARSERTKRKGFPPK